MDAIVAFFLNSGEYRNWGWNVATIGACGANLTTLVQLWGVCGQNQRVWKSEKAEVPLGLFAYFHAYFWAVTIYGIKMDSLTVLFNATQVIPFFLILLGVYVKRGFTLKEWGMVMGTLIMVPIMYSVGVEGSKVFLFVLLLGVLPFLVRQPIEIFRKKRTGDIDVRFPYTFLAASVFWFVYGIKLHDWAITLAQPPLFAVFLMTILLYHKYRPMPTTNNA